MHTLLAYTVLYGWFFVAYALFSRYRVTIALPATIIFGYLFIPERTSFNLPLLPTIDKTLMPSLSAAVMLWLQERQEQVLARRNKSKQPEAVAEEAPAAPKARRKHDTSRVLKIVPLIIGASLISPYFTWATNQAPLIYGPRFIPAMSIYDIFSLQLGILVTFIPLWLARKHMRSQDALIDFLKVFAIAGLVYSLLAVWEARMSPQINVKLYGFFAHSFAQHVRDGFRPIIFLEHGLRVGIFLGMATLCIATLARVTQGKERRKWLMATLWMLVVLYFSRNLGALMITLFLCPFILLASARLQFFLAMLISVMVLTYPMLRGAGVIPVERITSFAARIDAERAQSLEYRLENEDKLLRKANEHPIAGWGPWGRNRVYNSTTGRSASTTDGSWIIVAGIHGWFGYLAQFGLLCLPAIFIWKRQKMLGFGLPEAGLCLVMAGNLIDLIPNSSLVPIIWGLAGVLWGRFEYGQQHPAMEVSKRHTVTRNRNPEFSAQFGATATQPETAR